MSNHLRNLALADELVDGFDRMPFKYNVATIILETEAVELRLRERDSTTRLKIPSQHNVGLIKKRLGTDLHWIDAQVCHLYLKREPADER